MFRNLLLSSAVVAMAAGTALAQPGAGTPAPGAMKERKEIFIERADKLNLTDQQKKEMANLRIEMQRKNIPLQSQIRLARLEIEQLMSADKPEKGKIEKWMKEVSELQLQVKLNGLNHMFAVRAILTPDQLKEWKGGRHPGMRMGMGMGMGEGMGMPEGMGMRMRDGMGMRMRGGMSAPKIERRFRWTEADDGDVEIESEGGDEGHDGNVVIERKVEKSGNEKTIRLKVRKAEPTTAPTTAPTAAPKGE